jgi:hypothetical protein
VSRVSKEGAMNERTNERMAPCSAHLCAGIAVKDGLCAVHAAGYRKFDGVGEERCANCRRLFKKGEWMQRHDNGTYHGSRCKTHRDVMAEREKATT